MTTSGWAIKVSYADVDRNVRTFLLTRLYFGRAAPDSLDGYQTAVFLTRRQAREAARIAGRGYDRATAVKVNVTVAEELIPGYLVAA